MSARETYWDPPRGFTHAEKRAWNEIIALLHAQAKLAGTNPGAVEAAATQLARAREARQLLKKQGLLSTGSQGQSVSSPLLKIERDAWRSFLQACATLGLDGKAARRLHSPDKSLATLTEMIEQLGPSPLTVPPPGYGDAEPPETDFQGGLS
jgi:P27 family predicted phage terminase small subunit